MTLVPGPIDQLLEAHGKLKLEVEELRERAERAEGERDLYRAQAALWTQAERHRDELLSENDALRALLAEIRENGINAPMEDRIDAALLEGKA